jgi:lysophospholipase L1-like esterase
MNFNFDKNSLKIFEMKFQKQIFSALFLTICSLLVLEGQIKVACVGNSITFGAGIENRDQNSYPAQLGKLLGNEWEVKNFGVSGSTLLKNGDRPYWKQNAFVSAKDFSPDVVIIKLGTNDTKPQNWKYKDEFMADYSAMIKEFKELPSRPFIIVCLPVPAFPDRWGIRDSIITADIIPMIKKIAKWNKVKIIDLHSPLIKYSDWFPDKIHPNAEGAGEMARIIEKTLLNWKKKIMKRN